MSSLPMESGDARALRPSLRIGVPILEGGEGSLRRIDGGDRPILHHDSAGKVQGHDAGSEEGVPEEHTQPSTIPTLSDLLEAVEDYGDARVENWIALQKLDHLELSDARVSSAYRKVIRLARELVR